MLFPYSFYNDTGISTRTNNNIISLVFTARTDPCTHRHLVTHVPWGAVAYANGRNSVAHVHHPRSQHTRANTHTFRRVNCSKSCQLEGDGTDSLL